MWLRIASFLIRHRLPAVLALLCATVFMALQIPELKMQYKYGGILPLDDPAEVDHAKFLESFGAEGNVLIIGVEDSRIRTAEGLQAWHDLAEDIRALRVMVDGQPMVIIDSVFAVTHAFDVVKHPTEKRFVLEPIASDIVHPDPSAPPLTDERANDIVNKVRSLPFYNGLLYAPENDAMLMMVVFNLDMLNSPRRGTVVEEIIALSDQWSEDKGIETHLSGLPFIRIAMTNKVKGEIGYFIGAAMFVTALLLFLFFRNLAVVGVCMAVVFIGVIWSLGTIALLDYRITLVMSLIPALMIVIGVPNCIYLVNKYQGEFKRHGNKMMALQRMVTKVGNATLLTNATTAFGFATFIFTHSPILIEFGVVAALNIMLAFGISIVLIPALFTWLPEPHDRHLSHLDRVWVDNVVGSFVRTVQSGRRPVYLAALVVLLGSAAGMTRMVSTGNIVDDLPDDDRVLTDLTWIESRFKGVMPFEVLIDGHQPGQILNASNLSRIDRFQTLLTEYPEFSRSLSAVDAVKFGVQAFYGGDPDRYRLPSRQERSFMGPYFRGSEGEASQHDDANVVIANFVDSTRTITRVSAQMADVGTLEMDALMGDLRPRIDSIFPADRFDVTITGTSIVFLQGTSYLVNNLLISIALAIVVIALVMALLFKSGRMVGIALIPNLLPLLFTAGVMGWTGIPIKPSTILVFSVAFGISVDDTIHFLAKYRQELRSNGWNIRAAVLEAVRETGVSMMYTSIVLFFGFLMFALSEFDGTRSLGILVSVTLLVAMFTNLMLLPSLLMSFARYISAQTFSEPFIHILDEEEDLALESLKITPGLSPGKGQARHEGLQKRP
ncbi:MAG: MMPL family transporter [Bacteroidetes bacterium]|nr:MMPL family transporter [Bacteroidota bacterium]MDA0903427.1 MMPL family transporter [Bacteroidota bacterium]MDA1241541.1 MMPL family transporter [Bacteroidota bacterium]